MNTAFHQFVPWLPGMISEFGYEYLVTSTFCGRPNASNVQVPRRRRCRPGRRVVRIAVHVRRDVSRASRVRVGRLDDLEVVERVQDRSRRSRASGSEPVRAENAVARGGPLAPRFVVSITMTPLLARDP